MLNKIRFYMDSNVLLRRIIQGGSILAAGTISDHVMRFVRNMILARLLAPEAFGIMGTIIAVLAAFEALTQVGIRQAVIQNQSRAETEFLNVAWLLALSRGVGLYIIVFIASPLIGSIYERTELTNILRIVALSLVINGAISPRLHVLEKNLQFKYWVIIVYGAGIVGSITGVTAAFYMNNVWALVVAYMTESILKCSLSYIVCPIRPSLNIHSDSLHRIIAFSRRMFGLPILLMIFAQADIFVIGKVLNLDELGIYALAKTLAETPITVFSMIISPLLLPILAGIQDDMIKLRQAMLSMINVVMTFGIPFFAFLIIYAKPIVVIVYGEKYQVASIPFGILCAYAFFFIISVIIMQMFLALGRPDIQRTASIWRAVIFGILIYPLTSTYGLTGGSITILASAFISLLFQTQYTSKIIGLRFSDCVKVSLVGIKLSLFICVPGFIVLRLFDMSAFSAVCIGILCCLLAWIAGGHTIRILGKDMAWIASNSKVTNAN
jgi:lipopolysaccharide exporter